MTMKLTPKAVKQITYMAVNYAPMEEISEATGIKIGYVKKWLQENRDVVEGVPIMRALDSWPAPCRSFDP